jgi:hypothetical protein
VKDPRFSSRLLLSFNVYITVFQLSNATDEKIGVEQVQGGTKYLPYFTLREVTKE